MLIAELEKYGETVPPKWSMAEMKNRVAQLHEEHGVVPPHKQRTELREMVIQLNKASQKKTMLQKHCHSLGVPVNGNETMATLQRAAMVKIYETSTPNASDPVGFGKAAALSYMEIQEDQQYCQWVLKTWEEGSTCPQLARLARWLDGEKKGTNVKTEPGISVKMETHHSEPTPVKTKPEPTAPKGTASLASASSSHVTEVLVNLVEAMQDLKEEISELKNERPRKKEAKSSEHSFEIP